MSQPRLRCACLQSATLLIILLGSQGCAPQWVYSYVDAERLAKPLEKPILVFYRHHLDARSGEILERLSQPPLAPMLNRYVRCSLISAYDPNRRFLAQYGVTSPPAIVIIHPDGTFHSLQEPFDTARIASFLGTSKPPGKLPRADIQVTRPPDYLFRAEGTFEKAVSKAQRQNRDLLILYKWWLNSDSNEMIYRMSRPEIAARCTETINCILDWDYVPNREHAANFGVTTFPALIVVHQDGSYQTRKGLGTVEEIARFLSTSLNQDRGRPTSPSQQMGERPSIITE